MVNLLDLIRHLGFEGVNSVKLSWWPEWRDFSANSLILLNKLNDRPLGIPVICHADMCGYYICLGPHNNSVSAYVASCYNKDHLGITSCYDSIYHTAFSSRACQI